MFRDSFEIYSVISEVKKKGLNGMLNLFTFYVVANVLINLGLSNILYSVINLCICILGAIYLTYQQKSIEKLMDKKIGETREFILRNIIKNKGLEFVERIKKWHIKRI